MLKVYEESANCNFLWKGEDVLKMVPLSFAVERAGFMESFWWLEGSSGEHLIQPTKQGQLKQLVQDCVQWGFEYL